MIGVVLKKGTNYPEFETLLKEKGYTYTVIVKRVFYVECELETFELKDFMNIESCTKTPTLRMEPQAVDLPNQNVLAKPDAKGDPILHYNGNDLFSWGPHRIIRRKNPFTKSRAPVEHNHTLRYKSQRTGEGVDIYIIDNGFYAAHQDFSPNRMELAGGPSTDGAPIGSTTFKDASNNITSHGQHAAGCAASNNVGIARDSHVFVIVDAGGWTETEMDWVDKVGRAHTHYMSRAGTNRPAVVSFSYGVAQPNYTPSPAATAVYDDMFADGLIVCIPAANSHWDLDTEFVLPAETHEDIVLVGASDPFDLPMSMAAKQARLGTGYGSPVDIYAPGYYLAMPATTANDRYDMGSGTSYAGPYVAGVIACMLQGYQRLTSHAQVKSVIQKLKDNSTKGALRFGDAYFGESGIWHDRLVYLDPNIEFEEIDGLVPL